MVADFSLVVTERSDDMPNRPHIASLTGIRGLAAAWVFGFHLLNDFQSLFSGTWLASAYAFVFQRGALGVELFFVLSGFVLTINYAPTMASGCTLGEYGDFLRKRLARIYPNHLLMIVVLGLLAGGLTAGRDSPYSLFGLVQNLLLVHGWAPAEQLSWNIPSWSVSSELLAYLLFPIIATVFVPRLRAAYQVASGLVLIYVLIVFLTFHFTDGIVATETQMYPLIRILNFIPGVLLGVAYLKGWGGNMGWHWIGATATGGILVASWLAADTVIIVLLPVVIYASAKGTGLFASWMASPAMVYLGKTSYAFYMVQILVIMRWRGTLAQAVEWSFFSKVAFFLAIWMVNYALAHLIWRLVEEPGRKLVLRAKVSEKRELVRSN